MRIEGILDKVLLDRQAEKKNRERSGKWSPSSFGYCYRKQWYNRKNVEQTNPPDARTLRVFASGVLFHDFIQKIVSNEIQGSDIEVEVENDFIRGYADIVTDNTVYDIKTQHSRAFWHMEKEGRSIEETKFSNVLQVMTYAVMLNKPYVSLIYVSKDDLCIAEYVIKVTNEWKEIVKEEINTLNKFWDENILPPAIPRAFKDKDGNSKECAYCSWKDLCNQTEKERKENGNA